MTAAGADTWAAYRQRMLDETSRFIEWGLNHPHEVIDIPAKPAEEGGFPHAVAEWFWTTALAVNPEGLVARWRSRLASVRRVLPSRN